MSFPGFTLKGLIVRDVIFLSSQNHKIRSHCFKQNTWNYLAERIPNIAGANRTLLHDFHLSRPSSEFVPHTELIRMDSAWFTGVHMVLQFTQAPAVICAESNLPPSVAQRSRKFRRHFAYTLEIDGDVIWSRADDIRRSVFCSVTHMHRSSTRSSIRPLFGS